MKEVFFFCEIHISISNFRFKKYNKICSKVEALDLNQTTTNLPTTEAKVI